MCIKKLEHIQQNLLTLHSICFLPQFDYSQVLALKQLKFYLSYEYRFYSISSSVLQQCFVFTFCSYTKYCLPGERALAADVHTDVDLFVTKTLSLKQIFNSNYYLLSINVCYIYMFARYIFLLLLRHGGLGGTHWTVIASFRVFAFVRVCVLFALFFMITVI
jgi:hypothetical protein